ncbi:radical SAM protein [Desulfobacterales bacterium HSG17]|nr:radical SAM protein [Desulfobacterales bacterium HSG17]
MIKQDLPFLKNNPEILLVNPWIHDFAAYDFWAKPQGLLLIGAILREHKYNISYIDCLDRFHPKDSEKNPSARNGRGPYLKTIISKPHGLEDIPRNYSRYGIKPEWFKKDLISVPKPDLILVTSLMTYWYPGVRETIKIIKDMLPDVPVILGGIYATLCHEHAIKNSGADHVFTGNGVKEILSLVQKYTGFSPEKHKSELKFNPDDMNTYPLPALDLQNKIACAPVMTSRGCPFSCSYCASNYLDSGWMVREPGNVLKEIYFWHEKYKVKDFVFYDDALLINSEKRIVPLLEGIIDSGINVRFHTPNAVHIREINKKIANLMFKSGFKTIRLGLETAAFEKRNTLDRKVTETEFKLAAACLLEAGFEKKQIGAYLLTGLPEQTYEAVEESVKIVKENKITPVPAYYTPIPHTAMWEKAAECSRYNLEADPIFTNNAIFPCWNPGFSWETIAKLKNLIQAG